MLVMPCLTGCASSQLPKHQQLMCLGPCITMLATLPALPDSRLVEKPASSLLPPRGDAAEMRETMFRRWTWPSRTTAEKKGSQPTLGEPVLGLRGAMQDAGLASYSAAAEVWCRKVGAAFLVELIEEFEELSTVLGSSEAIGVLTTTQQHELFVALNKQSARMDALKRTKSNAEFAQPLTE